MRDRTLDSVRGYAMLLMVLGHCGLPYVLRNPIYSFHMPLFFFITGWFFSLKPFGLIWKTMLRKILFPFFLVNIVTAIYCTVMNIDVPLVYKSLLLVKTSRPIIGGGNWLPGIGPHWFLIAYFFAYLYFYALLRKIQSKRIIGIVLLSTFLICDIIARIYGLLPLGIMQGLNASIYIYVGYMLRNETIWNIVFQKRNFRIGVFIWVICAVGGFLSLASIYNKLSFFQVIGALYGTILFTCIVRKMPSCKFVEDIGRDSLIVLCIHALDIKISASIISLIFPDSISENFLIAFLGKILFVLFGYSIYRFCKSSYRINNI